MRTTITIECKDGKQFATGFIRNRENLSTILPIIEFLIEVVDFNLKEFSGIRNLENSLDARIKLLASSSIPSSAALPCKCDIRHLSPNLRAESTWDFVRPDFARESSGSCVEPGLAQSGLLPQVANEWNQMPSRKAAFWWKILECAPTIDPSGRFRT
jgi:hypothetical protein